MKNRKNTFDFSKVSQNRRDTAVIFYEAAVCAEQIVKDCYEKEKITFAFPVDIEIIAKQKKIKIHQESLNQLEPQFSRILAILSRQGSQADILVDNKVGYKTQRYAIANAIARYLLKGDESMFSSSYAIPLMPQSLEEVSADTIALFMLMPVSLFREEFKNYLETTNNRPLDVDLWLEYLSDRTQISPFNLAIGYQQMKMVLCHQRQQELRDMGEKIADGNDDPYGVIFA